MSVTTSKAKSATKVSSQNTCSSAFSCGAEYSALKMQVELLTEKVDQLETKQKKNAGYVSTAINLLKLQRFLLILLPIVELIVVGLIIYFFSNSNVIGYTVVGLIGITTLINGFVLPNQMKDIEKRLSKVEENSEE